MEDAYFVLRVASADVDLSGRDSVEVRAVRGFHWWTSSELNSTNDEIFPAGLAHLIEELRTA